MSGQHEDSSTSRWTKRGLLGLPVVLWYLLAATAVLAVAGWWVTLNATGTISTGGPETQMDIAFVAISETFDGNCTVAITGVDEVAINATGLVPGNYCEATFNVVNTGGVPAYYHGFGADWGASGFDNFGLTGQWDWSENGTPEDPNDDYPLVDFCGKMIPADGTPTQIGFRFDMNEQTASGVSHTFGVGEGFNFSVNPFPVGEGC